MIVKKQSVLSKIFWKIIIYVVGAMLILIAVFNLLLFFFGNTASASLSIRRVGGTDSGRPPNQRYEWSLDYTFQDENGILRSGHTTRRGSDLSVKTDTTVYYFSFAPFISALESDAAPNLTQPLYIATGVFMIYIMNRDGKRSHNRIGKERQPASDAGEYTYE